MSGCSFNYLYCADLCERIEDLRRMKLALVELADTSWAALDTATVLDASEIAVRNAGQGLRDVWKAVEWLHSCDTSEGQCRKDIALYEQLREAAGRPI